MQNPIQNNRIVNDETFAIRLKHFIEKVDVCDQPGEEEKDYILMVAKRLLKYQLKTATDSDEIDYLKRLSLPVEPPKPIDEEMLESLGFTKATPCPQIEYWKFYSDKFNLGMMRDSNSIGRDWSCHIDNDRFETIGSGDVQYLHQLCSLIETITGENFTFILQK